MKRILLLCQFSLILALALSAQDNIKYDDVVYDQDIGAVEFRMRGQFLQYPMMNLKGGGALTLSFDDFSDDARFLNYKLIPCNADWTPAELEDAEYLNGFNDNEIDDFELSLNTRAKFINYRVHIPNEDVKIIQPGNYIIYVYDTDTDFPVFTKRFLVLDETFVINPEIVAPSMVEFRRTHHEIDFEIITGNRTITNPDAQLNIYVLQNWRWDNAITNLSPRFTKPGVLNYDYNNKIVFEAGNEFRSIDARSFDYLSPMMKHIDVFDDGFGVHIKMDRSRYNAPFYTYNDINGDYVIQNYDEAARNARRNLQLTDGNTELRAPSTNNQLEAEEVILENFELDIENLRENKLRCDYGNFYFQLEALQELYDTDVYVVGQFCNWKLLEENRMTYNVTENVYNATVELKQGYYNYMYAAVPKGKTKINLSELEGSHFETNNEYIILVYYRGIGDRHDRLLGYRSIFSTPQ